MSFDQSIGSSHSSSHRNFVGENTVEEYDTPMRKGHWAKNKKGPSVNLVDDGSFLIDRQLADQRLLMQKNRNPQLDIPTNADKTRSQLIIQKKGASNTTSIKTKVLNKIVREGSGVRTYTLFNPETDQKNHQKTSEIIDIDTHPAFRPYASESQLKPVMASFGHRPKSASRTFNPATMKVRLRHNEVIKMNKLQKNKTGFGLPVVILSKILNAPPLNKSNSQTERYIYMYMYIYMYVLCVYTYI
jgi:hypothetical protein